MCTLIGKNRSRLKLIHSGRYLVVSTLSSLRGHLQLIMSAGGVPIATDQEQQLALVLMWPYSE